ncbi:hypothetical protein AXF42_Ash013283 [Apostasia shenzhenica]|uniref:Uncharacterized protein n=1 Tax=Apostasia shenzhenica TaxID=1088818 RepID=A0A2I0BBJ8_9ASPA|nr:hypothetical protein AXF42_Ash013283 [Apostasia shenzhenica]
MEDPASLLYSSELLVKVVMFAAVQVLVCIILSKSSGIFSGDKERTGRSCSSHMSRSVSIRHMLAAVYDLPAAGEISTAVLLSSPSSTAFAAAAASTEAFNFDFNDGLGAQSCSMREHKPWSGTVGCWRTEDGDLCPLDQLVRRRGGAGLSDSGFVSRDRSLKAKGRSKTTLGLGRLGPGPLVASARAARVASARATRVASARAARAASGSGQELRDRVGPSALQPCRRAARVASALLRVAASQVARSHGHPWKSQTEWAAWAES